MKAPPAVNVLVASCLFWCLAVPGYAAEKTKPYPHYWISVSTSNQSLPGMPAEMTGMAGLFGGKDAFGPRRDLLLQVESPLPASGQPQAAHEIPPGQKMGAALPLVTPKVEKREYEPSERTKPEKHEKPKARMLIYWGCGETIGKGQPKVIDTARLNPAEFGKVFSGRAPTQQNPPSVHKGWIYAEWPNNEDKTDIPKGSSLIGDHLVRGNYLPDIKFSLDKKRDFMAPVKFSPIQATQGGAMKVEWQSVPTSIGYFASAMGHDQKSGDSIFWSSSEVPEMGFALQNFLTPADVSRFIREKVVMDPGRTTCTVPPIFKEAQGAMLQFIAYGEELNLVYPPRPKDPRQHWDPRWSVKVRLKSTGMTTLMANDDDGRGSPSSKSRRKNRTMSDEPDDSRSSDENSDSTSGKSKGGVGERLKGIFGF